MKENHKVAFLTVRELQQELQVGRTMSYKLLNEGVIPSIRLGRTIRVPREALRRYIEDALRRAEKADTPGYEA